MARPKISVVIIGKNEENNVEECLQSVAGWAEEIVFVDGFSTDRTVELVKKEPSAVVYQREMEQEGRHRNYGAAQASYDWIMILDCDERATPEVKEEIDALFDTKEENQVVYWIPRKNYIGDHWLRYGGWYPAPHMKLYNRKYFRWKECVYDVVHPGNEFIEPGYKKGPNLKNHLIHHNYKNVEDFIKKTNRLTTLDGIKWYLDGRHMPMRRAFWRTIDRFFRRYVRKKGYKDGYYGFIASALSGFYELAAYSKLREIRQRGYYLKENGITEEMIASAPLFAEPSGGRKFLISLSALPTAWKTAWRNIKGQKFESEVEIVRKLVQPGSVCLDAGGAYGRYTYALARSARNVKVLVFEPVRFNCAVLRQIKALFWLGSVEIQKMVLGDKKGKIYAASPVKKSGKVGYNLSYTSDTVVPNAVCERVDMDTIDAVMLAKNLSQLDVIICDTEGSELRVMQGARQTLSAHRPLVMCSVEGYRLQRCGDTEQEVEQFFRDQNYQAFALREGQLTAVEHLKEEANYFFIPQEKVADVQSLLEAPGEAETGN